MVGGYYLYSTVHHAWGKEVKVSLPRTVTTVACLSNYGHVTSLTRDPYSTVNLKYIQYRYPSFRYPLCLFVKENILVLSSVFVFQCPNS
jgi:hypothetical protein